MAIIQQHLLSMESWSAWTNVFGTSNNDWTYSNNVDDNSNVYLVGLARNGTWGRAWGCLHKFNSAGVFQWGKSIGNSSQSYNSWFVSCDVSSDRIVVQGQTLNNPNAPHTGNYQDVLLAMYDLSGNLQWQKIYGKVTESYQPTANWSHHDLCTDVLIDSSNNVYICGNQQNQCGSGIGVCNANALLSKFNSSGTLQWQKKLHLSGEAGNLSGGARGATEQFTQMVFDSSGNIICVGVCEPSNGTFNENFLVVKFNTSGSVIWQKKLDWGDGDWGNSIALDSSDNIYLCGGINSGVSNSNIPIISKFNSSMTHQWTKKCTSLGHKNFSNVECDSFGNVYALFYDDDLLTGSSDDDLGIIKFDSSGNVVWQRALGGHAGSDIMFTNGKPMNIVGNSFWVSTHGSTGSMGSSDRSVSKYPINGSMTGTYTVDGETWEYKSMSWTIANGSAPSVSDAGLTVSNHDAQVWTSSFPQGGLNHTYTYNLTTK